jgi:Flp pilus assembly protein TadG
MALVTPILVMLVFGIIQFGIVFAQKLALSNAAREAARAGVVAIDDAARLSCQQIADQVKNTAGTVALNTSNITVGIVLKDSPSAATGTTVCSGNTGGVMTNAATKPCAGATETGQLIVTASTPASLAIPFAVSTSLTLDGKGAYRCEYR